MRAHSHTTRAVEGTGTAVSPLLGPMPTAWQSRSVNERGKPASSAKQSIKRQLHTTHMGAVAINSCFALLGSSKRDFSASGTIAHGSIRLPPRSLASSRSCSLATTWEGTVVLGKGGRGQRMFSNGHYIRRKVSLPNYCIKPP